LYMRPLNGATIAMVIEKTLLNFCPIWKCKTLPEQDAMSSKFQGLDAAPAIQ